MSHNNTPIDNSSDIDTSNDIIFNSFKPSSNCELDIFSDDAIILFDDDISSNKDDILSDKNNIFDDVIPLKDDNNLFDDIPLKKDDAEIEQKLSEINNKIIESLKQLDDEYIESTSKSVVNEKYYFHRRVKYNKKTDKSLLNANNKVECHICKIFFNSDTALNDHYLLLHHKNSLKKIKNKCNICNKDMDDHIELCKKEEKDLADNIPTNIYGEHQCPICSNRYATVNFLGEHFIISHSNYSELSLLDKPKEFSFPGFDILVAMGMIEPYNLSKINKYIEDHKSCDICSYDYKYMDGNDDQYDIEKNNRYTYPHFLKCCDRDICNFCLELYISKKNIVICPYCKKDFENSDLNYIIIYDYDGHTNDSWKDWWLKHYHIFDVLF